MIPFVEPDPECLKSDAVQALQADLIQDLVFKKRIVIIGMRHKILKWCFAFVKLWIWSSSFWCQSRSGPNDCHQHGNSDPDRHQNDADPQHRYTYWTGKNLALFIWSSSTWKFGSGSASKRCRSTTQVYVRCGKKPCAFHMIYLNPGLKVTYWLFIYLTWCL